MVSACDDWAWETGVALKGFTDDNLVREEFYRGVGRVKGAK